MTNFPNAQNNPAGAIPVYVTPGVSGAGYTPAAGAATAIVTGGTAVTAVSGPINGGYIINPSNASGQGIATSESLYVDMVNTPGSTDAAANGTTSLIVTGGNFSLPAVAAGVNVKVNAATAGHKFTVVVW